MLKGKHIILGITGSIAAYKAAYLTRALVKAGAEVKIIITPYGKEFITPVTLATLSKNTVLCDFFHHDDGAWNSHVDLGIWADLFLIAPASANTIAKMAHGICDNLLLTTYLSARCPVMIAPAMDCDMYGHKATQDNIEVLKNRNHIFVDPEDGELASGLIGKGRMAEPEIIIEAINNFFLSKNQLFNKKFVVTAGPTYEPIDPVRFIGNYSSGKMGYAIAEELAFRGASVTLISGPCNLSLTNKNINIIKINTAAQMYEECKSHFTNSDGLIMSAAVADFTTNNPADKKIKNKEKELTINLTPTIDIIGTLGKNKNANQILVGFALETHNELENAYSKLSSKNLDFIILNSLNDNGAGFGHNTNKVSFIFPNNKRKDFELKDKKLVAKDIVDEIIQHSK